MVSLTKEERLVLILVSVSIVAGLVIHYLFKASPGVEKVFNAANNYHQYLRRDVNKATYEELLAVPYLGPQLAKRIVDYRQEHGPIKSLSDLKTLKGVGTFKFKTIEKYLMVIP